MNDLSICYKGYVFGVSGDYLRIGKDGIALVELCVAPVIEGKAMKLSDWSEIAPNHLAAQVEGREATVHLEVDHGHVCFHMETALDRFERLHYFTEGRINGAGWQTYLSDVNDCFRSYDVDAEVPISSCFNGLTPDEADGEGMTDPGDVPPTWIWNVPIRVLSLHTECGWLGLSLPGPLPVGVTRLAMKDRRFSMGFEELRPACEEAAMPRVYFLTGLAGAYDALEVHRDLSMALGWMVRRDAAQPAWWAKPTFKPAMDLFAGKQGVRVLYKSEQGEWACTSRSTGNIPEYGGLDKVIHPYTTHWRDLPEKDRRRRTAGIQVYLNAPMNRTDVCRVTWEHGRMKEVWRRRSQGRLKGFYAALAISPRCFVTYSERCARIGSSESHHACIPIPPGSRDKGSGAGSARRWRAGAGI